MAAFEEQVAVVTGGGQGIGAAVVRRFAAEGARVVIVDLDREAADALADSLHREGASVEVVCGDVGQETTAGRAVAVAEQRFGGLDVLVNNAGVMAYGDVPDVALEDWERVLRINLTGQFLAAKAAIPALRRRGGGSIVTTASVQAFATQRSVAAYSASKAAVVTMTRTLALDHATEGIRVNAVAPGSVRTPMLEAAARRFRPDDPEGALRDWGAVHPIGRIIEPEEVAEAIAFLAGPRASAITGTTLVIDGGLTCALAVT